MMLINPYVFGAGGPPPGPAVTWNPADKDPGITLGPGDLNAINGSGVGAYKAVRATKGIPHTASGYFEIRMAILGSPGYAVAGVATAAQVLNSFVGSGTDGWGYYADTGGKVTGGGPVAYGAPYTGGDVLGFAFKNGKVWFAKNGVWQAGGDPAAGTGEAFSGITGTIYPIVSLFEGGANETATGRFAAGSFSYAVPTGFVPWE